MWSITAVCGGLGAFKTGFLSRPVTGRATGTTIRYALISSEELIDVERETSAPPEISKDGNNDEGGYQEEGEICADEMHAIASQ